LLHACQNAGRFLGGSATNVAAFPEKSLSEKPLSEKPGSVIGPYKVLQQIGEGGFGVVFMAEQTAPVRGAPQGGLEGDQAGHGYAPGDRPL
jgi:hypothetical protein